MTNPFKTYRDSYIIKNRVTNPKIISGEYSYYAGYHHGKHFEECVWYLDGSDTEKDCDKLIIGKSLETAKVVRRGHLHRCLLFLDTRGK